jgi:hypothetical protein
MPLLNKVKFDVAGASPVDSQILARLQKIEMLIRSSARRTRETRRSKTQSLTPMQTLLHNALGDDMKPLPGKPGKK